MRRKLYVWERCENYAHEVYLAMAGSVDEARKVIAETEKKQGHCDYAQMILSEPKVFDSPTAFSFYSD